MTSTCYCLRQFACLLLLSWFAASSESFAQSPSFDERLRTIEQKLDELQQDVRSLRSSTDKQPNEKPAIHGAGAAELARIRDEGLNRSQLMPTLSYLTDVIGPRLTGSPNLQRANKWTRDKLTAWGLANAHLESWGPFGRGWSLKSFSIQVVEPQAIPLIACPKAWTPGFDKPITADVVYLDAKTEDDLAKYRGKLKGTVVLVGAPRAVRVAFEPQGRRMSDEDCGSLPNRKAAVFAPQWRPPSPIAVRRRRIINPLPRTINRPPIQRRNPPMRPMPLRPLPRRPATKHAKPNGVRGRGLGVRNRPLCGACFPFSRRSKRR